MKIGWKVKMIKSVCVFDPLLQKLITEVSAGSQGIVTKIFGDVATVLFEVEGEKDFHKVFWRGLERVPRFNVGEELTPIHEILIKSGSNVVGRYAVGERYKVKGLIDPSATKNKDLDFAYMFIGPIDPIGSSPGYRGGTESWIVENFCTPVDFKEKPTSDYKNNDNRTTCYACGGALKTVDTGFSHMNVCKECGA